MGQCFNNVFNLLSPSPYSLSYNSPKYFIKNEGVIHCGQTMKVVVPECPLANGSLKITSSSNRRSFSSWEYSNKVEAHHLLQQIVKIWEKKGINDYIIYGKESSKLNEPFSWEIIPYPKKGFKLWQQFKVLWNITFRGARLSGLERKKIATNFIRDNAALGYPNPNPINTISKITNSKDAFCNPKVIEKQIVFAGKEVNILYNYAPLAIGKGKLHFMVVPKRHVPKFSDLTQSEYLESMHLTQKLTNFYKRKRFHTAYFYDKSGARAGQAVPHFHEHVVFTATKTQEFFGKLTVLKNMLFGSSPLRQNELLKRIYSIRKELLAA